MYISVLAGAMSHYSLLKDECIELWRSGSKPRTIKTAGLSMRPLIPDGSTLTFIPSGGDRPLVVGDIALFERSGRVIAHRIVGRYYQEGCLWYREKGDDLFAVGCFERSALIGRVVTVAHGGHVRELRGLRQRLCGRALGIYWYSLFALLRVLGSVKRSIFGPSPAFPRLQKCLFKAARFFSRLPSYFIKQ